MSDSLQTLEVYIAHQSPLSSNISQSFLKLMSIELMIPANHLILCHSLHLASVLAHQAPLSVGFSRHEYWSGLPFPSPGHLPHPGIEPGSLTCPALAGGFFTTSATWEALVHSDQRQKWRCFAMGNEVNSDTSFPRCRVHQGDEGIYSGFLRSYEVLVRDYWERNLAYFSAHIGQNSFGLRAKKQDSFYVLSYYLILLFCQIIDLEQRGGERDFSWQNI